MSRDHHWYAFVEKGCCQGFQPVLHNVFCLLVTPQTLSSWQFLEVEKQVIITWNMVRTYGGCLKISHLDCFLSYVQAATCSCAFLCFPWIIDTISSHHLLSLHLHLIPQQSACEFQTAGQTFLAFKNNITNHLSRVAGIFSSSLTTTTNGGNIFDTVLCNARNPSHTADDWPQELHASPACSLCAIGSYFLDAPYKIKKMIWDKKSTSCHCKKHTYSMSISARRKCMTCMISNLCHNANEICAHLGLSAAWNGNSVPMFQYNLSLLQGSSSLSFPYMNNVFASPMLFYNVQSKTNCCGTVRPNRQRMLKTWTEN